MTPAQISAIQAHAAKIQAAFEAMQLALCAAHEDEALPPRVRAEAEAAAEAYVDLAEDNPWFNGLEEAADVTASFE